MLHFNTLIVGQGIAGSLLAFQLHRQQRSFKVLDAGHANSASRVAAGMFTPVSGKRKTMHTDFFQQLKLAVDTYRQVEFMLGTSILHLENVYQLFDNEPEKEWLTGKALLPEYRDIFQLEFPSPAGINTGLGGIAIKHSGWVDCPLLINSFRQWLLSNQLLVDELFDYGALQTGPGTLRYNGMQFNNIVFCEGYRAAANPFFNVPLIPCKGDIISIAAKNTGTNVIIKKNAFYMLPGAGGIRRVGATFKFHESKEALQAGDRQQLEQATASMLDGIPFKTVHHHSAIRATTPGQQVIARQHPSMPHLFMLNGLGTKGILLGPWYAAEMVEMLARA